MKITCKTALLHSVFQFAGSAVQQRPTRPILGNVLLTAKDGCVEVHATDLEIGLRLIVQDVQVAEDGRVAVPQGRMTSILRETTDETVVIESGEAHCVITTPDSEFRLPTEPADEFPELPAFEEDSVFEFNREEFVEMVTKTSFAAYKGKHRYALNGVLIVLKPSKVEMVATDGRRLTHIEKKAKNPARTDRAVIVPTKALDIIRELSASDEKVRINILGDNQLLAKTGQGVVSTRLVEGHFPPYESVIPKEHDKRVDLPRERFHSAVRRAALVTSPDTGSISLTFSNGKLDVHCSTPEAGEARISLPVEYKGDEIEIAFNPEFLSEFLRVLSDETVRLEFRDSASAGLFRAGKELIYVVMPVTRE